MDRDPEEPVAHICRALRELITEDGEPYEDTLAIMEELFRRAIAARGGMGLNECMRLMEFEREFKLRFGNER